MSLLSTDNLAALASVYKKPRYIGGREDFKRLELLQECGYLCDPFGMSTIVLEGHNEDGSDKHIICFTTRTTRKGDEMMKRAKRSLSRSEMKKVEKDAKKLAKQAEEDMEDVKKAQSWIKGLPDEIVIGEIE